MAVRDGFGKIATDGLVFAFDAGDPYNSYKGKPGTNLFKEPVAWVGDANDINYYNTGQNFYSQTGEEFAYIPTLGTRRVKYVKIKNDFTGCGPEYCRCCPSLFRYGDWGITVEPSTTYAYTLIYKCDSGYTNPNYLYHYQYGASGYITEYGLHNDSNRTHLGDGWYFAWGLLTTNAATTTLYPGMWYYNYNIMDKVSVAAVNFVKGTEIRNPKQMFLPSGSRTSTEALIDLTGNVILDVSTVSFDSSGVITFDGTDDYIDVPAASWNILTTHTLEAVFKPTGTPSGGYHVLFQKEGGYSGGAVYGLRANDLGQLFAMICYDNQAANQNTLGSAISITNGTWYHVVATFDSSYSWKLYVNGELHNSTTLTGNPYQNSSAITIGQGDGRKTNGQLPVMKIYNRALTATEVSQNFNHYKSRYNL
jgi:hypothetical protein